MGRRIAFGIAGCLLVFAAGNAGAAALASATTHDATDVTAGSATLRANVAAGARRAIVVFDYGTSASDVKTIGATPGWIGVGGRQSVMLAISGLGCATTYFFRVRTIAAAGSLDGDTKSFTTGDCTTPPPPPPPPPPGNDCSAANVLCVDAVAGAHQEYATIQAAVNAAQPGDTVLVFDGNYTGFVISRSGTATAPITVKANGSGAVINSANTNDGEGITMMKTNYVVIDGFTVTGMPGWGIAAHGATPTSPMHGLVIRDNTVRNCGSNELYANIYASEAADSLIEGNISSGSTGHGMYLANAGADNTIIRGNLLFNNAVAGLHVNGDESVGGDGIVSGATIEDNIIHDNGQNGLNFDGLQDSVIRNNLVYNNAGHALRAYAIDASAGPRNLRIVNNTFVVKASASGMGIKLTEDDGGHTIFNNVIANEGGGGSIAVEDANFHSDHNTFVNALFSLNGGGSMITLAQWRAQAGAYDAGSLTSTEAALFAAPSTKDYRLRAGSPAVNAGVATFNGVSAPGDDIAGVARPQGGAFDQGAYESF